MDKEPSLEKHKKLVDSLAKHGSCEATRAASWKRTLEELKKAEGENKPINLLESTIGIRLEELEWEVRDAVIQLLEKGYTTYYSGYEGNDGFQKVCFLIPEKLNVDLETIMNKIYSDTGIYTWWEGQWEDMYGFRDYNNGKPVYISGISFVDTRGNPQLLHDHWNRIAESLPPSGYSLLTNDSERAQKFRKSHSVIT